MTWLTFLLLAQHGGAFDHRVQWHGTEYYERLGQSVAAGADITGDGRPDYCIGSLGAGLPGNPNLGYVEAFDGVTLQPLWRTYGQMPADGIGAVIHFLGDQNGDTVPDVLASCPDTQPPGLGVAGSAWILSGADGSVLMRIDGRQSHASFGKASLGIGDLTGDGVEEFAISAPREDLPLLNSAGRIRVFRGGTFQLLGNMDGPSAWSDTGTELAAPGDLNGDTVPDLIASSVMYAQTGAVLAYSGANGSLLWLRTGNPTGSSFGDQMTTITDRDGDAVPEVLATDLYVNTSFGQETMLAILSGRTGALISEWPVGPYARRDYWDAYLPNLLEVGDVNGDASPDIAMIVGKEMVMVSGSDLTRLGSYREDNALFAIGPALAGVDLDGDGRSEILVGDPDRNLGASSAGSFHIVEWSPALSISTPVISAAAGGTVSFDLQFAGRDAGRAYAFYGSRTGTGPTMMMGVPMPLSLDAFYHRLTPNPPARFVGAKGTLTAAGAAQATLLVPPGALHRLVGRTLWFCGALPDSSLLPEWTSVAVALRVVP